MYKIISRAINTRLNKIVNRICSRAQKGFNNVRYTQEVLINVWETIKRCKTNGINGAVMAVDMAKAFDTLSNDFLDKVFRFFGFGPTIRNWLTLLGTNRTACIMLENGTLSRNFNLERGRPQGDNISPNTFNFCIQILIFKLELDPGILGIPADAVNHARLPNIPNNFLFESCRETGKNEGLADDNTSLVMLDLASLTTIKSALAEFGNISGLMCNYDKSVIMPINNADPALIRNIESLGFTIVDSFKLLGLDIKSSLDNSAEIYSGISDNIRRLILFWERFRLTLPGRLSIMKTCLLSQLNYIGCFLPAPDESIDNIQRMIDGFVKKNLPISAERMYLPANLGGIGLINLKIFLQAQHCSWIGRAVKLPIDNWRFDLRSAAPDSNILLIRPCDLNPDTNPILSNFVNSYVSFYGEFCRINGNYKEAYIFSNPAFTRGPDTAQLLDAAFFANPNINAEINNNIRALKFCDCFLGNRLKSINEFRTGGVPLTAACWLRLQTALLSARNKLKKLDDSDNLCESVSTFMSKIVKGSKKFRSVLENQAVKAADPVNLRTVLTFSNLANVPVPPLILLKKCLGLWNSAWIHNDMRNFLYLLRNNGLPLNNRLNAFDPTVSAKCSFCRIVDRDTAPRDSFSHFFYDCQITTRLLQQWCSIFEPPLQFNEPSFRQLYWYGINPAEETGSTPVIFVSDTFKYVLWKFKQRKKIPNFQTFIGEVFFVIQTAASNSQKICRGIAENNLITNFLQARG